MPWPEVASLLQSALVWPWVQAADAYGRPVVAATPTELSPSNSPPNGVRWKFKKAVKLDKDGNTITLDATVIVAQYIQPESLMWPGTLDEWNGAGSSSPEIGVGTHVYVVKTVDWLPDIKNRARYRELGLMRFKERGAN